MVISHLLKVMSPCVERRQPAIGNSFINSEDDIEFPQMATTKPMGRNRSHSFSFKSVEHDVFLRASPDMLAPATSSTLTMKRVHAPTDSDAVLEFPFKACETRRNRKSSLLSNPQSNHTAEWEPWMRFPYDFAKVVKRTMKMLEKSELIADVEKSQSASECLLTIRMSAEGVSQKDQVLAFARKALLDIAAQCKSIYIIGFRSPCPFIPTASGFDVKYGAMENANAACWHHFKKGFCRYGEKCHKQHSIWEMPTRVLIEAAPSEKIMTWDRMEAAAGEAKMSWARMDIKSEM